MGTRGTGIDRSSTRRGKAVVDASLGEARLQGIETFVRVAETGSFALAAERLRVTRSAVSKVIARLEARLDTRLIHRSTRRQSLTAAGEAYFERCKRALAEIDAAEAMLDDSRKRLAGRLRVSLPRQLGRHVVAPILWRFAAPHPELQLDLSFSDSVVDLIEEGFDLAVRQGRLPDSSMLAARSFGSFDFVICAAPSYLRRHGRPRKVEDFERHPAIVYVAPGPPTRWSVTESDGTVRELRVQRRLQMDDVQAIFDATLEGRGLGRLPRWQAEEYVRRGELAWVFDDHAALRATTIEVHAVWPQTRFLPARTRAAIDALAKDLPQRLGKR